MKEALYTHKLNPFSDIDVKYIPALLASNINDKRLLREPEKLYELQVTLQMLKRASISDPVHRLVC